MIPNLDPEEIEKVIVSVYLRRQCSENDQLIKKQNKTI